MWKPGSEKPKQNKHQNKDTLKPLPKESIDATTTNIHNNNEKRKATLSQKTLAMKFMQRKKSNDAAKKKLVEATRQQNEWVVDDIEDSSHRDTLVCMTDVPDPSVPQIFGRRSFGGFNRNVEEEYREASKQLRYTQAVENELRDEISAEEMTSRMIKYTGLARGANSLRNKRRKR